MRHFMLHAGLAAAVLCAAVPAGAAVVTTANTATIDLLPGVNSFNVDYTGRIGDPPASSDLISAFQTITFTGLSNSNLTWNFSYSLTNDSANNSRVSNFGFNVLPDINDANNVSATGAFPFDFVNANYPTGLGNRDICFDANGGGSCTGGGSGGITSNPDLTGNGTFALTFGTAQSSIQLSSFAVRFQSISPSINGADSGTGTGVVTPIPEPATWAMMLVGFGAVGYSMRRRRRTAAPLLQLA